MDDLISEFVEETSEALSEVENDLLQMEQDPEAEHDVGNLFRLVHTIKGTCSFIGLDRLGGLAHASENILGKVRDREMSLTADAVSAILEAIDVIGQLLEGTAETGSEPEIDVSALVARLDEFAEGSAQSADAGDADPFLMDEPAADDAESEESGADEGEQDESDFFDPDVSDLEPDMASDDADSATGSMTLADILGMGAPSGDTSDDSEEDTFEPTEEDPADEASGTGALTLADILGGGSPAEDEGPGDEEPLDGSDEPEPDDSRSVESIGDILAHTDKARKSGDSLDAATAGTTSGSRAEPVTLASILAQCGPGKRPKAVPDAVPAQRKDVTPSAPVVEEKVASPQAPKVGIDSGKPAKDEQSNASEKSRKPAQSGASLRVNVDLLEHMMTLVGELVLTRNQMSQLARQQSSAVFDTSLQRLRQVTVELQEGIMKTRMQPIGNAWNKLPRIVRDLSKDLGKKIELEMHGADTELDRQVLDLIKDPLTHMVRNSADHGIESLEKRRLAGKPDVGTVRLEATHKESHIVITLSDDGGGLDASAIRGRVIERGLAKAEEAEALSDHQLHQFIFAPGFSTAKAVTSVSGRGVGMDVVRTNIEKMGGSVSLESEHGKGTCFTIRIPLTLAILPVLIIGSGEERYALPQINLQEVLQIRDMENSGLEHVSGSILFRYREDLIPVVDLGEICGHPPKGEDSDPARKFVVICKFATITFGVICDRIFGTEEIIAKPVARILKGIRYFSGNAILGDGSAIFILDPNALASKVRANHVESEPESQQVPVSPTNAPRTFQMIIFECVDGNRKALPITLVERVEEVVSAQLEKIDGKIVVQHEGKLMPVLEMDDAAMDNEQTHSVIVFHDNGNYLGMRIAKICDIAELEIDSDIEDLSPGCLGATVSDGRVIEILDVAHMMSSCFPKKYGPRSAPYAGDSGLSINILLVDDSRFFRNFVGPLLQTSGYNTTVVERPSEALELFDKHPDFHAIISDIEMPDMDGYELLRCIRSRPKGATVPVIALSSYGSKTDIERGLNAGFNAYVSKLDKDGLFSALQQALVATEKAA